MIHVAVSFGVSRSGENMQKEPNCAKNPTPGRVRVNISSERHQYA